MHSFPNEVTLLKIIGNRSVWRQVKFSFYYIAFMILFLTKSFSQQRSLKSVVQYTFDRANNTYQLIDSTVYYHHTIKQYTLNGLNMNEIPYFHSTPDSFYVFSGPSKTINYFNTQLNVIKQDIFKYDGVDWNLFSEAIRKYDINDNITIDSLHIIDQLNKYFNITEYSYSKNKIVSDSYQNINGDRFWNSRIVDSIDNNNNHVYYAFSSRINDTMFLYHEIFNEYDGVNLVTSLNFDYQGTPGTFYKTIYVNNSGRVTIDSLFSSINKGLTWDIWKVNNYFYNSNDLLDRVDFYANYTTGEPLKKLETFTYVYNVGNKISKISAKALVNKNDTFYDLIKVYDWNGDELQEYKEYYHDLAFNRYGLGNSNYHFTYTDKDVNQTHEVLLNSIYIYPNPFNDHFSIQEANSMDLLGMSIKLLDGKLIQSYNSGDLMNIISFNKNNLISGYYIIEFITNKGRVIKKVLKL